MSERLETVLEAAPWAPLAVAFLTGLICGWLVWGLGRSKKGDEENESSPAPATALDSGDEQKEIVVLRAELEAARALLHEGADHEEEVDRQLTTLDEAIKRANGRLKILLKSVKR